MELNILHLSDLHIEIRDKTTSEFHKILLDYIIDNFKSVDFLVLTGDFGNRCFADNVNEAKKWITKLVDGLSIPKDHIIICPGNHDMDVSVLPGDHHLLRTEYVKGQDYINNGYNATAFNEYYKLEESLSTPAIGYVKEYEQARFIVLNSSWLSQINDKQLKTELNKFNLAFEESENDAIEDVFREFGFAYAYAKRTSAFKVTLNHSENTTQQLGLHRNKEATDLLLDANFSNEKINFLIFHHPEVCLHLFERHKINNVYNSGIYKTLLSKSHLLLCGHIHPSENFNIHDNFHFSPTFIGGAAHIDPKLPVNGRPIFYSYKFTANSSQINCDRSYYIFETESKTFTSKSENDLTISYPKKGIFLPGNEEDRYKSPLLINNEDDFRQKKQLIFDYFIGFFLENLRKVDTSFYHRQITSWIDLGYKKRLKNETIYCSEICSINLDIIMLDEYQSEDSIKNLIKSNLIKAEPQKTFYYPLIIDTLSFFCNDYDSLYKTNASVDVIFLKLKQEGIIILSLLSFLNSIYKINFKEKEIGLLFDLGNKIIADKDLIGTIFV